LKLRKWRKLPTTAECNTEDTSAMEQEHNISIATTAEMKAGDITPAAVGSKEMRK